MAWTPGTDEAGLPFFSSGEGADMKFVRPQDYGRDAHDSTTPPPDDFQVGAHTTAGGDKFNERGQFSGNLYAKPSSFSGFRDIALPFALAAAPGIAQAAGYFGGIPALDPTGLSAADVGFNSSGSLSLNPGASSALGIPGATGAPQQPSLDPTGLGAGDVAFDPQGKLGLSPDALGRLGIGSVVPPRGGAVAPGSGAPSAGAPSAGAVPGGGAGVPGAAGGVPGATGGAAGGAGGAAGGSFVDQLIKQMKDNAVGLGLIGASALMSTGKSPTLPQEKELQALSTDAQGVARQLIGQYQSGALSPGQQASLDQMTQGTKNQLRQYFASIGQSNSTSAAQAEAQVDQTALAMKQQMLDSALQQGLSAIGVASGPLNQIAQYELGQDQQLRAAFGNFAGAIGNLFGRQSGTPTQTSATSAPTITSAGTAGTAR